MRKRHLFPFSLLFYATRADETEQLEITEAEIESQFEDLFNKFEAVFYEAGWDLDELLVQHAPSPSSTQRKGSEHDLRSTED